MLRWLWVHSWQYWSELGPSTTVMFAANGAITLWCSWFSRSQGGIWFWIQTQGLSMKALYLEPSTWFRFLLLWLHLWYGSRSYFWTAPFCNKRGWDKQLRFSSAPWSGTVSSRNLHDSPCLPRLPVHNEVDTQQFSLSFCTREKHPRQLCERLVSPRNPALDKRAGKKWTMEKKSQ